MMTDPIADMLSRLRNAAMANHVETKIPLSKLKVNIAKLLKEEGYIEDYNVGDKDLSVTMKYDRHRQAAFNDIQRKSRPGRRVYVGAQDIDQVKNGLGIAILSTSRGILTDKTARKENVGGEVLCEVW